jgi:LemA protein
MLDSLGPAHVIGAIVLIAVIYIISIYNALVRLRNHISEAWSNVDTELTRRYELIPNLVAVVKGYAAHERETLERVIELRNTCIADTGSVRHQEGTEKQLVGAMQKLLALADVNTEDRIQAARRFYNGNVRDYRNLREGFPSNVVANMFAFEDRSFFDVEPSVRTAPAVELA